ncbi:MAG: S8 family serine peptidase [Burkholderiales bacterium]|nr:S8 family serine peptidase [Burkholderiales bacterium]
MNTTRISRLPAALKFGLLGLTSFCMHIHAKAEENARYIVHYKDGSHVAVKSAILAARANVQHQIHSMNAVAIEATPTGAKQLLANRDVSSVEVDVKRYPLTASTPSTGTPYQVGQQVPYGIKLVQADQLPSGDANVSNRKICIIDTGLDRTHEDLSGNTMTGEYDSGTGWWYTDEGHHGTHVAGTIAAINNSGVGVVGVNPNKKIKLHIVKVFDANGWAYSSSLAAAANKCKAAGANIISMSLGGPQFSAAENSAFDAIAKAGILSIAAAGNDGNTALSYPAGYASVVSVGALDENKQWASFSQYNSKVELSAPGVGVLSTVPMGTGTAIDLGVTVANVKYSATKLEGSPSNSVTGALTDFGIGTTTNAAAKGKVCLIQRGTNDFATKVKNCQSSGGIGAIIYNNVAGGFTGTLGTAVTTIPSVSISDVDGKTLKGKLGISAAIKLGGASNYASYDGTSMATPHVSAVAALVWSYFPTCTAAQLRTSLGLSALDLGTSGRDVKYGYGLVQAKAAYDRIKSKGCGK